MKKFNIPILLFVLGPLLANAQALLTLDEAVAITLANNYGIQIAKNNVLVAENNTERRANGYLPTVSANAGVNSNLGGSNQSFSNGLEAMTSNAFTWGTNAAVRADYTIYDKRRGLTMEQLRENLNLANLQLRLNIEQSLLQVYAGYYQVARLTENLSLLREAMGVSKERLRRAQYRSDYGQGTGLDVLNAEVDIQRDSVNLLNTQQQLSNARRNLNVLMGRATSEAFQVDTSLNYTADLNLPGLLETAKNENIALLINRQNLKVGELGLKIIDAEENPTVSSSLSYNFNYSDNPDGAFINTSNSRNLAANVGVNWTIFDGTRKIRRQNSQINLANQTIQRTQLEQELERDLINAWENYQNALFILNVEQAALNTNRENFDRTEAQLNSGRLTSIEFRQAQLNLLNAQVSLNAAKYDAKLRELELLQLAGRLLIDE